MRIEEFDYHLPEELIAQHPIEPRDASRLLVLDKETGAIAHSCFQRLGDYLKPGDVLVINDTKVLPARLFAQKTTGAAIEIVILKQVGLNQWQSLVKPGKKALPGAKLVFPGHSMQAEVLDYGEDGTRIIQFDPQGDFFTALDEIGQMPLPHYIREPLRDKDRYQPVYARERGSAAAPTAGLHFTKELLADLEKRGVMIAKVLLHVGLGTFRPVKVKEITAHKMHAEYYQVTPETAAIVNRARQNGGRVVSVGTTSTRTLETLSNPEGVLLPGSGWTDIFIYPGYQFKIVDALITNFHLPKSTLVMLVAAFAGREHTLHAYEEAIRAKYRFYSFGDAMFII